MLALRQLNSNEHTFIIINLENAIKICSLVLRCEELFHFDPSGYVCTAFRSQFA